MTGPARYLPIKKIYAVKYSFNVVRINFTHSGFYRYIILFIFFLLPSFTVNAFDAPVERRRDQYGTDFSYFVYPIGGEIPGLGSAFGAGATVLNMFDSDADFTGFKIEGDFDASGYTLLDLHLMPKKLIFDFGFYDFLVSPVQYNRGLDSDKDDFILPKVKGNYWLGQLTWSGMQRQFEAYVRHGFGNTQLLQVLDKDGTEFMAIDDSKKDVNFTTIGAIVDLTDDRLDPRKGMRFEVSVGTSNNDNKLQSDYYVTDYNFTGYKPFRRRDTLAYNAFFSKAHVTRKATTDYETLRQQSGLGCDQLSPGPAQTECLDAEASFVNEQIARNRYGLSSSLGGTQRLRSFDGGRFYASNTVFYGLEYRLNLTEEFTPFDIYIAKGIRTGMQLSFFIEQGSVADKMSDLWKERRTSYGAGFRLVLSGVIIRADIARGEEGNEFILFINYPWSMFSVDNPG